LHTNSAQSKRWKRVFVAGMVCEEVEGLEEQGCGCGDEWIEWRWSSVWEEVRKEHLCSISQLSTSLKDQSSKSMFRRNTIFYQMHILQP
jgi:hypothetical protein